MTDVSVVIRGSGRKTLVQRARSGELAVNRWVTWGMPANYGNQEQTMKDERDISVVVFAKDNAATISATLDSLLSQEHVRDVIVCLAPSRDGTRDVIEGFSDPRVMVIEDPGQGISLAMNMGIEAATGDYFAKIDADDLVMPGRFAWQRAALIGSVDLVAVCAAFDAIDESETVISRFGRATAEGDITPELLGGKTPTHFGTYLTRMDAIRSIGGFREWFVTGEDVDLPLRLANVGNVWFKPVSAYQYRIRGDSITHVQPSVLREFYNRSARQFAKQRLKTGQDDLMAGNPPDLPLVDSRSQSQKTSAPVKWSQKSGQLAKVYPERLKGCENGKAPEFYRSV